jgi:hypothetical protein
MPNPPIVGQQDFQDSSHRLVFRIDPDSTFVQIVMKSPVGFQIMQLTNTGSLTLMDGARMDGILGQIFLGGGAGDSNHTGKISLMDGSRSNRIFVDASSGIWVGGNGLNGRVALFPAGVANSTSTAQATIFLDGNSGDIVLQNADCAEDFDIAGTELPEPGAIMVIDDEGKLRQSERPYDRTVAGVISGAGEFRPGIVLDRKPSEQPRAALAMVGKVYCKVDASYHPIAVGDLLTTSATPGHAMRAVDPARAFGAVIGKALRPHREGPGMIPILVALQ